MGKCYDNPKYDRVRCNCHPETCIHIDNTKIPSQPKTIVKSKDK